MTAKELHTLLVDLQPEEFQPDDIPPLLVRLAAVQSALMLSWSMASAPPRQPVNQHDQLLTAEQAAGRLNVSVDYLYRHAGKLPFTVRQGRLLRFSANGINEYIRYRVRRK